MEHWEVSSDMNLFMDLIMMVIDFTLTVMCVQLHDHIVVIITGRKYDKDGVERMWWTEEAVQVFNNRSQCFVNQYSMYKMFGLSVSVTYIPNKEQPYIFTLFLKRLVV